MTAVCYILIYCSVFIYRLTLQSEQLEASLNQIKQMKYLLFTKYYTPTNAPILYYILV